MKILITTSSFGKYDVRPLGLLRGRGYEVILNPFKRKINKDEALKLYKDDIDGVIAGTENIDVNLLKKAKRLKVISRCGAGTDNVDIDFAESRGIKVFSTPDAPTNAVAELAVGLILSLLRHIALSDREIRKGIWKQHMGELLQSKTVGIVGFGRIGQQTAKLLKNLGARIIYYDPVVDVKDLDGFKKSNLRELLKESDIISLHLSYSEKNKKLIGKKELALMKKDAFLINTARGAIVDENALYDALKNGALRGAALDVFAKEPYVGSLRKFSNVILTSHIGSYAKEARVKMEIQAAENLLIGLGDVD